jgi:hypothetical protein
MEELIAQREEREALLERRIEERLERQMQKKQAAHDKEIKRIQKEKEAEMKKARQQEKQAQHDRKRIEEKKKEQQRKEQERKAEHERKATAEASQAQSSKVQSWSPYSVTIGDHSCAVSGPRYYKAYVSSPREVNAQLTVPIALWMAGRKCKRARNGSVLSALGARGLGLLVMEEELGVSNSSDLRKFTQLRDGLEYSLQNYPYLAGKLGLHGVRNLEFCVLGPGQKYYARWVNGTWCSQASEEVNNALTEIANRSDGSKVLSMAIGYNDSYVISFGFATGSTISGKCGHRKDLKGYYSDLSQFAYASSPLDIVVSLPIYFHQTSGILLYNRPLHLTRTAQLIISWSTNLEMASIAYAGSARIPGGHKSLVIGGT